MAAEEDDLEAIAWPGFVDILSSVIIMFVFFLMIIAGALYLHMVIFVSRIKSEKAAEQVQSDFEFLFKQQQTEFAESKEQNVEINQETNEMIVFFGRDAISILPETKTKVEDFLKAYPAEDYDILITAPKPNRSTDITKRKIAIARMFNLRNTALEAGFKPENAIPKLINETEISGSLEWSKLQVIKK